MTESKADSSQLPALLTATPSAERVGDWLRTLAALAGVLTLLIGLFALELVGRI